MALKKIYLQGSNGETDIENRLMDMGRGEERVRCMERVTWLPQCLPGALEDCMEVAAARTQGSIARCL